MHDALAALDGGFAVESPSGVCSSAQKLKSWLLRRMFASYRLKAALVHICPSLGKSGLSASSGRKLNAAGGARNRVEESPRFRREFATV